eukprot:4560441-Pyramimonas_sp.AAC.1
MIRRSTVGPNPSTSGPFWFGARASLATCCRRACQRQIFRVLRSAKPWGQVAGTAGAMLLSLFAVGWRSVSAFVVVTEIGDMLDFRTDAPISARELAGAAAV